MLAGSAVVRPEPDDDEEPMHEAWLKDPETFLAPGREEKYQRRRWRICGIRKRSGLYLDSEKDTGSITGAATKEVEIHSHLVKVVMLFQIHLLQMLHGLEVQMLTKRQI